jgi:hypothetical protein
VKITHARVRYAGTILVMVVALAALLTATAPHASAATAQDCQAQLTALSDDTWAAADSFSNTRDVDGLVGKIGAASAELAADKNSDALLKLDSYQAKLTELAFAPKPKVDPAVAVRLSTGAEQAAACIGSIA